jgi:hypothetical protein
MHLQNMESQDTVIDVARNPGGVYLIDTFTVPAAARPEFEAAMRRNRAFIRTLAAWESAAAIERAKAQVTTYYESIGFDMQSAIQSWGVTLSRAICSAPDELQQ